MGLTVLSLLIGAAITLAITRATAAEKKPRFVVSQTETIASSKELSSRLVILWDGQAVPNVCLIRVAFWNAGSALIDAKDFLQDDPLRIESSAPVMMLQAFQAGGSRKTLRVSTRSSPSYPNSTLLMLPIDEALEADDGAEVQLVYAGGPDVKFSVAGRIKGAPRGFESNDSGASTLSLWLEALSFCLAPVGFLGTIALISHLEFKGAIKSRTKASGITLTLAMLLVIGCVLLMTHFTSQRNAPSWVSKFYLNNEGS